MNAAYYLDQYTKFNENYILYAEYKHNTTNFSGELSTDPLKSFNTLYLYWRVIYDEDSKKWLSAIRLKHQPSDGVNKKEIVQILNQEEADEIKEKVFKRFNIYGAGEEEVSPEDIDFKMHKVLEIPFLQTYFNIN